MSNMNKSILTLPFPKNSLALTACDDIGAICAPLRELGAHHFNYLRIYPDGSRINLSNNAQWIEYFYAKKLYEIGTFDSDPALYSKAYIVFPKMDENIILLDAHKYFNLSHASMFILPALNYCEFFYFSGHKDEPLKNKLYLQHEDLLERFIFYFKDRAKRIIAAADRDRIKLPLSDKERTVNDLNDLSLFIKNDVSDLRKKFIRQTPIKHYYLPLGNREISLSDREIECLLLTVKGYSAADIAASLYRSSRTIEVHLANIKTKFRCRSKLELIDKFLTLTNGNISKWYNKK